MDNITKRYLAMDEARHAEYAAKEEARKEKEATARQADLIALLVCGVVGFAILFGLAAALSPIFTAIKYSGIF